MVKNCQSGGISRCGKAKPRFQGEIVSACETDIFRTIKRPTYYRTRRNKISARRTFIERLSKDFLDTAVSQASNELEGKASNSIQMMEGDARYSEMGKVVGDLMLVWLRRNH